MKRFLIKAALFAVIITPVLNTVAVAADVGVSINIGQPDFYGRLDINGYPQPQLLYRQPKYLEPESINQAPIYMRVPPGHAKKWRKHCHEYNACNERVWFVRDSWYRNQYAPRYQEQHGNRGEHERSNHGSNHGGQENSHQGNRRGKHGNNNHGNNHGEHRNNNHGNNHGNSKHGSNRGHKQGR